MSRLMIFLGAPRFVREGSLVRRTTLAEKVSWIVTQKAGEFFPAFATA